LRLSIVASLERHPRTMSHPDVHQISRLMNSDDISNFLSAHGWWTPAIVTTFRNSQITVISLASSIESLNPAVTFTERLLRQGEFEHLASLSLAGRPLSHIELSHLRPLRTLRTLDLASTSLSTVHLLHLVTHSTSLRNLNISTNPSIDDDARVPLSALTALASLHLRGTSITIPCLRLLVYSLSSDCRFITLPSACLHYLNMRSQHYCVAMPIGYVQDPRVVPGMTVENLKKNLELHKAANKDVSTAGNKVELVERLMALLCGRVADGRIVKRVGKARGETKTASHHEIGTLPNR
jgi:hypothetical protein